MHLLLILLDTERLAVAFFVLKDVRILLTLQPLVLQVKQNGVIGATAQNFFHAVTVLEAPGIIETTLWAFNRVGIWLPFVVRERFEVVEDRVKIVGDYRLRSSLWLSLLFGISLLVGLHLLDLQPIVILLAVFVALPVLNRRSTAALLLVLRLVIQINSFSLI